MPFTVMSCDNLPGNGRVTENAVAGIAELVDPALAAWVKANVAFPNGIVDRITPATSDRERALLRSTCGIVDARPVFCEAFRQWVLEDHFPAGRPALERVVGVQFVADVAPFELMKIRILNGGHAAIAYAAALLSGWLKSPTTIHSPIRVRPFEARAACRWPGIGLRVVVPLLPRRDRKR